MLLTNSPRNVVSSPSSSCLLHRDGRTTPYRTMPMLPELHMRTVIPHVRWPLLSLVFSFFFLLGCTASRVGKDQWLAPFRYTMPPLHELRANAVSRSFPGTFDEVWEAVLTVLAKSATIAEVQKNSGSIVYFTNLANPYAVFVEDVSSRDIRVWFDLGGYAGSSDKKPPTATTDRTREAEKFFAQLSVQLLAEKRWQPLATGAANRKTPPNS